MAAPGSVTLCIARVKAGDQAALQDVFNRFFDRLVGLARQQLRALPRPGAGDAEGAAQSAMAGFWLGLEKGQYPKLFDRKDLWHLLAAITVHKAAHQRERENAVKRGGGVVLDEAAIDLGRILSREPTPELAAELAEDCRRLLDLLPDVELRTIALLRMEGYSNNEIAGKLDYSTRKVERKIELIRNYWQGEVVP